MSLKLIGVKTNNLKNINIEIPYNKITAITGVSGGGKSSLAYETLHALCHQEFRSLESGYFEDAKYIVDEYSGLIPSVAIRQKNIYTNPRSTLYSYLNISSILSAICDDGICNIPQSMLKLNSLKNECSACNGVGEQRSIDTNMVVDWRRSIAENPFLPWQKSDNDKKLKLLLAFCQDNKIPVDCKLRDLSGQQLENILHGKSTKLYEINFKHSGRYRRRKEIYQGVVSELCDLLAMEGGAGFSSLDKYTKRTSCPQCHGSRVNTSYADFYISGLSARDFLLSPVVSLLKAINHIEKNKAIVRLNRLFSEINDLGLGHLSLTRSIPSLSGGEIQKLNFGKLQTTDIANILVVIDEISSHLHVSDYGKVFKKITRIRDAGNTVVLVEHSEYFAGKSDGTIAIGPVAGEHGGFLIPYPEKIPCGNLRGEIDEYREYVDLPIVSRNNVSALQIKVPKKKITAICGKSGIGKTSYAEGLCGLLDDAIYINQTPIRGNIRSTVASYLELSSVIADFFSEKTLAEKEYFVPSPNCKGACSSCDGRGVIQVERSFEKSIILVCPECNGSLFSEQSDLYKVNGTSIRSFYEMSFRSIVDLGWDIPSKLSRVLIDAIKIGLGHLCLVRKTQTLSGGEGSRLKLLKYSSVKKLRSALVIDEPGAGLDDITAVSVMDFIKNKVALFEVVLVIDHKKSIFSQANYLIELGKGDSLDATRVIFAGSPHDYLVQKYNKYLEG